jgi:hypothetical protein
MQLSKAFDPQALVKALEAKGIADTKQTVNDAIPVIFDWFNSSVAIEVPAAYGALIQGVLAQVESKGQEALKALEDKIS